MSELHHSNRHLLPRDDDQHNGYISMDKAIRLLMLQELSASIHHSELQERINILKEKVEHTLQISQDYEDDLSSIENNPQSSSVDKVPDCLPQKIKMIEICDNASTIEEESNDSDYEFHDFLSETSKMLKRAKVLSHGVAGDSLHDWQSVLRLWRKVIDDCRTTWSLIINQLGNEIDVLPQSENNTLHRSTRFFHFQLYLALLTTQMLCVKACLQLSVRSCQSCNISMKSLFQPLADGKLIGESIAMVAVLMAAMKNFVNINIHKLLQFSHSEIEQLLRTDQFQPIVKWIHNNYRSVPNQQHSDVPSVGMEALKSINLIPPSLLPKDLFKEDECVITPLIARVYRFHTSTVETMGFIDRSEYNTPTKISVFIETQVEESLQLVATMISYIYNQFLSRGNNSGKVSQSRNDQTITTLQSWLEQIMAYCHVGLARYWDGAGNDIHSDLMFANAIIYSLYEFKLDERLKISKMSASATDSSSLILNHSSLISIASVATRLIDRYDNKSHHIGLFLLCSTLREFTLPSTTVDFVEWSLPKLQQTLEVVTSPLAQIICFRLLQTMLSTSDQSLILMRNNHILLSTTSDDIKRDFVPYRVWVKLIPLHISLLVIPDVIIGCQLSVVVDAMLHCLNLWHLPSQTIVLHIFSNLFQRLHEEMEWYADRIFTELFRMKVFYSRRLLPDISGAEEQAIKRHLEQLEIQLIYIAKSFPHIYKHWLDVTTGPHALRDYLQYTQAREKELRSKESKSSTKVSISEDISSLEYVSNLIDEFNHNMLFGVLE